MKMKLVRVMAFVFAITLTPAALLAQKEDVDKKSAQQIIITLKGDKKEKMVVEVNGDKVTINGKPIEDFKEEDINVKLKKLRDIESLSIARTPGGAAWNFNQNNNDFQFFMADENRAMLGVSTEKDEKGAKVIDVTKESAAEKAGLKQGDIITKIDDTEILSPENLSEVIKKHKPGDKVAVSWLRDKKVQMATAELLKWKGVNLFGVTAPGRQFNTDMGKVELEKIMPRLRNIQGMREPFGQGFSWSGGSPKLGLSVQDTDDGKGVKVIEVDEESNAAKAGIKEDDIITHLDEKQVNGVDEISKLLKEKKENPSVRFQVTRKGKSQNIEVKMPRKIKTADL